jgi:hypothetical protein
VGRLLVPREKLHNSYGKEKEGLEEKGKEVEAPLVLRSTDL